MNSVWYRIIIRTDKNRSFPGRRNENMDKKNIDWSNLGFGYIPTDKRYVSNYKDGAWDEGMMTSDANVVINECAGVLQYAQTIFEGMKAYTTEDGHIVTFRPDLNAKRMVDSAKRLEMPAFPGRQVRECGKAGRGGKCGLCAALRFRRNLVYQAIYVRLQSGYRSKTG